MPNNKSNTAGKGDKLRRGITQDEWEKNWEEIFSKKKNVIRTPEPPNSGSNE
jgi:hypothetical protein